MATLPLQSVLPSNMGLTKGYAIHHNRTQDLAAKHTKLTAGALLKRTHLTVFMAT